MLRQLPSLFPWKHSKTKIMAESTMDEHIILDKSSFLPCEICGRTFLPDALKRHTRVCERTASRKRKVFDSLKQRVLGTDLEPFHQRAYVKNVSSPSLLAPLTNTNAKENKWKEKHLELVQTIRAAKGVSPEMSSKRSATSLSLKGTSTTERCPSCDRQFGFKAFDRHVEWCKERQNRIHKAPASVVMAKERLEARTKYRVPPLGKSGRTLTREKYSPHVNRAESVSSVRTDGISFERSPSVRKPKSVGDMVRKEVPRKEEVLKKHVEKAAVENGKIEPAKIFLTKKNIHSCTKINKPSVNQDAFGIMVAPLKIHNTTRKAAEQEKKLVTWKDTVKSSKSEIIKPMIMNKTLKWSRDSEKNVSKSVQKIDVVLRKNFNEEDVDRRVDILKSKSFGSFSKDLGSGDNKDTSKLKLPGVVGFSVVEQLVNNTEEDCSEKYENTYVKLNEMDTMSDTESVLQSRDKKKVKRRTRASLDSLKSQKAHKYEQGNEDEVELFGTKTVIKGRSKIPEKYLRDISETKSEPKTIIRGLKNQIKCDVVDVDKIMSMASDSEGNSDEEAMEKYTEHLEKSFYLNSDIGKKKTNEDLSKQRRKLLSFNKDLDSFYLKQSRNFRGGEEKKVFEKFNKAHNDQVLDDETRKEDSIVSKIGLENVKKNVADFSIGRRSMFGKEKLKCGEENDLISFDNQTEDNEATCDRTFEPNDLLDKTSWKVVSEEKREIEDMEGKNVEDKIGCESFLAGHVAEEDVLESGLDFKKNVAENEEIDMDTLSDTENFAKIFNFKRNVNLENTFSEGIVRGAEAMYDVRCLDKNYSCNDVMDKELLATFDDGHGDVENADNFRKIVDEPVETKKFGEGDANMLEQMRFHFFTVKNDYKSSVVIKEIRSDEEFGEDVNLEKTSEQEISSNWTEPGDDLKINGSTIYSEEGINFGSDKEDSYILLSDLTMDLSKSQFEDDDKPGIQNDASTVKSEDDSIKRKELEHFCETFKMEIAKYFRKDLHRKHDPKFSKQLHELFDVCEKFGLTRDRPEPSENETNEGTCGEVKNNSREDKSVISLMHAKDSFFADMESIEGDIPNNWSEALSSARLRDPLRKCHSDVCLCRTPRIGSIRFSSSTVFDLSNYLESDKTNTMDEDKILELAGEELLATLNQDLNSGTASSASDIIPYKRMRMSDKDLDVDEYEANLKNNLDKIKQKLVITKHEEIFKESFSPRLLHILRGIVDDDDSEELSKDKELPKDNRESSIVKLPQIVDKVGEVETRKKNKVKTKKKLFLPLIEDKRSKGVVETIEKKKSAETDGTKSTAPEYNPFITAERQLMELLECDDFKPSTPSTPIARPHTTTKTFTPNERSKKTIKSADSKTTKTKNTTNGNKNENTKRSSVIDPPLAFDDDKLKILNDDFELMENLINDNFGEHKSMVDNQKSQIDSFFLCPNIKQQNGLNLKTILSERKYSDDMSSIDPHLINENDNLSIPEDLKADEYSPTSSLETFSSDVTLRNDNEVDVYSIRYDKKIASLEPLVNSKIAIPEETSELVDELDHFLEILDKTVEEPKKNPLQRTKSVKGDKRVKQVQKSTVSLNSRISSTRGGKNKNLVALKRSVSLADPVPKPKTMKSKQDVDNYFQEQEKSPMKNGRASPNKAMLDTTNNYLRSISKPEDLFSVDDEMYEEYKKYEEMYLREKEEKLRKEREMAELSGGGVGTASEDDDSAGQMQNKISVDSAYGSLNRKTPKVRARSTKLSPLEPDCMRTSSSSETSPVPKNSQSLSKFCHECGNKYPVTSAKFCVECGVRRLVL